MKCILCDKGIEPVDDVFLGFCKDCVEEYNELHSVKRKKKKK